MSSQPTDDHLNDTHKAQLLAYLKYFNAKKEEQRKEIDAVFEEQKDMRLLDEMYSLDDVSSILSGVQSIVSQSLSAEFERITHQFVLYLRQLLLQAEGNGISLQVDMSTLDDSVLLAGIDKLELELKRVSSVHDLPEPRSQRLQPVSGAVDVKLVTQIKDLQDANKNLLAKFEKLQQQCMSTQKDNQQLREDNEQLEHQIKQTQADMKNLKQNNKNAQQEEIEHLRNELFDLKQSGEHKLALLRDELKQSSEHLNSKVNAAPQYQQLKKLMNTKNEQLKEARARIKQLEEHLGGR